MVGKAEAMVEREKALAGRRGARKAEGEAIANDRKGEVEKRSIAEVVRERIAVEKTVEQEASIKRLRGR